MRVQPDVAIGEFTCARRDRVIGFGAAGATGETLDAAFDVLMAQIPEVRGTPQNSVFFSPSKFPSPRTLRLHAGPPEAARLGHAAR